VGGERWEEWSRGGRKEMGVGWIGNEKKGTGDAMLRGRAVEVEAGEMREMRRRRGRADIVNGRRD
jgi:hypothetical protein